MSDEKPQPNDSPAPSVTSSPFRETLAEHLSCLGCNYDLIGMQTSGSCPECDLPIEESIQSMRLLDAPDWHLLDLSRGIRFIQIGVFLLPPAVILGFFAAGMMSFVTNLGPAGIPRPPLPNRIITGLMLSLAIIPSLLCTLPLVWGHWLLTHPLKSPSGKSRGDRLRMAVRGMSLWIAISPILLVAAVILDFSFLTFCAFGIWLLGHLGIMSTSLLYMSMLARQIPADRPARLARSLAWIIPISIVAISVVSFSAGYLGVLAYALFATWFRSFIVNPKQRLQVDAARSS